jgi:hypothetical protein
MAYTDDELKLLIDLAKAPMKKGEKTELTSVQSWITALDIKRGLDRVDTFHLYCEYLKWAGESAVKRAVFYKQIKDVFGYPERYKRKHKSTERYRPHYMLDATPFDMTLENKFLRNNRLREIREEQAAKKRDKIGN